MTIPLRVISFDHGAMRKIFIVSNFRIDLEKETPLEMIIDDIIDAARDYSTVYLSDPVRSKRHPGRYTYTLTIKEGLEEDG